MKFLLRLLLRLLFRFRAYNEEALNTPGPVLLVPNHVSWLDWLLVGVCLQDDWRFVVSSVSAQTSWLHRKIMLNRRTFPVDTTSAYAVKYMAAHLQKGGRLVLFAEGRISRTGSLMKLFEGTGFLLFKTHAKVITCHLRGAERILASPHPGWRRWFPRVTAHFSPVLTPPVPSQVSTAHARVILTTWLRDQMIRQKFQTEMEFGPPDVLSAVRATAAEHPGSIVMQDATFQKLTRGRVLLGAELLAQQWEPLWSPTSQKVGVLLPNINATPVVILSLWMRGLVPAILNYTTGPAILLACAQLAGLKQIITSRQFIERAKLNLEPLTRAGIQLVCLEDVRSRIGRRRKLFTLLRHRLHLPSTRHECKASDTAVVLFTSGSEGTPKGVELTHANLLANLRQILAMVDINDTDRLFNALPIFHSFGLTIGTLLPLVRGLYVFIYPSPLHYRVVPGVVYSFDCTILCSTNTFLNGYARKADPYDFRQLRYLFAGAEKLQETTAKVWAERFGVRILEGYGATECSPVVSVNTPLAPRSGTVGRFFPGIEWKLEPVEGVSERPEKLTANTASAAIHSGRLLVRGPNVMRGYLNADANAKFQALGGWYDTGDIVRVDEDGYLHILGRLKRFAKISGEMVSLTAVEDALAGAFPQYGLRCQVAVISRPDPDKGEMLIAVTNEPRLTLEEIRAAIRAKGLPNLAIPRDVKFIKEIPKLGTGKVNHRELQNVI